MNNTRIISGLIFFSIFAQGLCCSPALGAVEGSTHDVMLEVGVGITRCYLTPPTNCRLAGEISTLPFKIPLERWVRRNGRQEGEFWNGEARQWFLAEGRRVLIDIGATKIIKNGIATYHLSLISITKGEDHAAESLNLRNIKDLGQLPEVFFNGVPFLLNPEQRIVPVFLIRSP